MDGLSKKSIVGILRNDIAAARNAFAAFKDYASNAEREFMEYLQSLEEGIRTAATGPLIPKTPKVPRKRNVKRIETIPEDDVVVQNGSKVSCIAIERSSEDDRDDDDDDDDDNVGTTMRSSRRAASLKASGNIKKQQAMKVNDKMRRPSEVDEEPPPRKPTRASRAKKAKIVDVSSDEEEPKGTTKKYSSVKLKSEKIDESEVTIGAVAKVELDENRTYVKDESADVRQSGRSSRAKRPRDESVETTSHRTSKNSQEPVAKKAHTANSMMDIAEGDATIEPSMYEDAVGKSIPMNSTMNPNSTVTFDRKMMNVTVVLESLQLPFKMNETVTTKKSRSNDDPSSRRDTLVNEETESQRTKVYPRSPLVAKTIYQSKSALQDRMKTLKKTMENKEFNELITDDESSPERQQEEKRRAKKAKKTEVRATTQRTTRSSLMSNDDDDDIVAATPTKTVLRDANGQKTTKNMYKTAALFSPWAKDSVKKRVEAFEQVQLNSPKSTDVDAPTRQTRTKTRAMAAAAAVNGQADSTTTAQKAARETSRKSLAKAKKIALAKEMRENEDKKENNATNSAQKSSRLFVPNDKLAQKQQQRTTPVGKSRLQIPMSVSRIPKTPAGSQIVSQKAHTASKGNIVMSVDTFLTQPKTLTKTTSTDNLTEKKRKINDEDARRKRDEALRAKIEEKKRKREEKEMRNKLAREYNEKLEMEKRLKQERDREEKARAAQSLQDKQREEFERKRLLQLQRAQEKEERRKQEEQMRLQRLQEQEEAERELAEQKRREQEAERRRQLEARAQQLAANEAARLKAQIIAKAKVATTKTQQVPTSYKLDSEPEDEDTDDESKPKNPIPYWAQPHIRKTQLKIDSYIPMPVVTSFFGAERCTPDLAELFQGIKKERLQRTSSAIWKTPPRYSMMVDDGDDADK